MALRNVGSVLIDGSMLEGGGQILRNSVSYASLLSTAIKIHKIRDGRKPTGLKNQHRTGLELAARISNSRLLGATNGSQEIEFIPGRGHLPGEYHADSVTAGSITLLLQISLPLLLFSPSPVGKSKLILRGGTNASMAPQVDYTEYIFLPFISRHFGLQNRVNLDINKRGYFPKGGGQVTVTVDPFVGPESIPPMQLLERGAVKWIAGVAHFAGLGNGVGTGMVKGALRRLKEAGYAPTNITGAEAQQSGGLADTSENVIPIHIEHRREPNALTTGAGSGIVLWAELQGGGIIGGSSIGRKAATGEQVGREAADELVRGLENGGCIDEWLQDQIILFMALAKGTSTLRCGRGELTLHTRTAIWLAQQLTAAEFNVETDATGHQIIRCEGIGYSGEWHNNGNDAVLASTETEKGNTGEEAEGK